MLEESDLLAKLSPYNVFYNLEFLSFSENPGLCRYGEEEGEIEYGNGPENQCQKSLEPSTRNKETPKKELGITRRCFESPDDNIYICIIVKKYAMLM